MRVIGTTMRRSIPMLQSTSADLARRHAYLLRMAGESDPTIDCVGRFGRKSTVEEIPARHKDLDRLEKPRLGHIAQVHVYPRPLPVDLSDSLRRRLQYLQHQHRGEFGRSRKDLPAPPQQSRSL